MGLSGAEVSHQPLRRRGLQRSKGTSGPKRRGRTKRHTECFSCSRIFFDRLLAECPHCGSAMVRHYSSEELNYLSQALCVDAHVEFESVVTASVKAA